MGAIDVEVPGVYLNEIILEFKDGNVFRNSYDPNSKVTPTYNISVLSEGLTFSLRQTDISDANKDILKRLFDKLIEVRVDLDRIGYSVHNNGKTSEQFIDVNLGSDISYAKSLMSEEVYIYTNRSDS